jgi:hypothetical protein
MVNIKPEQEKKDTSGGEDIAKYLTDIKELPGVPSSAINLKRKTPADIKKKEDELSEIQQELKVQKETRTVSFGAIFLIVLNFIFVIVLAFILSKLPGKAKELKELINQELQAEKVGGTQLVNLEIENMKPKTEKLEALFPDERGLVDFVRDLDELKNQGFITNFNFASKEPVKDKTGLYGVPVIIEFRGSWSQIGEGLLRLQNLPFMFRAVKVETEFKPLESVIQLKYGGFLYVNENFGKD